MRLLSRLFFLGFMAAFALLGGCTLLPPATTTYHVVAYKPHNPDKVRVDVSLSKQNVYVMEGNRCLMAVATSVGTNTHPTPRGHFHIYNKIKYKRSGSYGFRVQGDKIIPADAGAPIKGKYVGYPMGFWCEFAPGYGFHQGFVHPVPRTHGCLRLHGEAAPKFFALVHDGTPVYIAQTQPEDATIGPKVDRVDDSKTPDPDPRLMITSGAFQSPTGPLLKD